MSGSDRSAAQLGHVADDVNRDFPRVETAATIAALLTAFSHTQFETDFLFELEYDKIRQVER